VKKEKEEEMGEEVKGGRKREMEGRKGRRKGGRNERSG